MAREPTISERNAQVLAGRHPARQAQPGFTRQTGVLDPGPLGGFIASAVSAIPEFLGADPTQTAMQFRAEHPWAGLASELPAFIVPYAGAFKLSRLPALTARLEGTVARLADPVTQPIRAGAVREIVRYAPLEASRLAVGGMMYPENFGELFADVAFATGIAGGIGAVGGIFRAAGRADRVGDTRVVRDADVAASPTLQLQMLRAGAEPVDPRLGREAAERMLVQEVFGETAGRGAVSRNRLPTIAPLEGARGRQDWIDINQHFSLSEAKKGTGVRRQSLLETPEARLNTVNPGDQVRLIEDLQASGAAIRDVPMLAESVFHPRVLTALDKRGAKELGRLTDNPTMQRVNDNLWLGREAGDGLHVGLMRLRGRPRDELGEAITALRDAGERLAGVSRRQRSQPQGYGPGRVEEGDRFLLFKTNQPGRFAPKQEALLQSNYSVWAGLRPSFQEPIWNLSRMGQVENELLSILSPKDFRDLHRMSRQTWVSRISERATKRLTGEAGLTDSVQGRAFASGVYDLVAPTMFKQGKNSLYARFELTMRARVREVERQLNKMFFGQTEIGKSLWRHVHRRRTTPAFAEGSWLDNWRRIPVDERQAVVKAAYAQPKNLDELAEMMPGGVLSAEARTAIQNIQKLDRRFINEVVLPELEAAGLKGTFDIIEGVYFPTPRLGDFFQAVTDEAGKTVAFVTGKTGTQANRQAAAIVAEAKAQGRRWQTARAELQHATEHEPSDLDKLFRETMRRVGQDEGAERIIHDAMKRLSYIAHPTGKRGTPLRSGSPGFFQERSGVTTLIDMPTEKEFLQQVRSHYERLGRYASMQGWSERWGPELQRFRSYEPTLYEDLARKRAQYLGIEGQITNTLNKTLQPLLGGVMGSKPATRIAQVANDLMYKYVLAWVNPTFALLNALTPVMTALPQIAFTLRASGAANVRLNQFFPLHGANGPVGVASHLSPLKVLWQAVRDMRDPDPALRQMIKELTDDGSLHAQLFEEFVGYSATGPTSLRQAFKSGDYVQFFSESTTYMARKSEEFSRVLSAAAGFRLGRDILRLEGPQLKHWTRRFVENTNYLYGVTDRSRIFTGPIGGMAGLFKTWQMHYMGMMSHYAGLAWRENVWSPLLWMNASAISIGGLGATPLRHLADGLSNWHSGDPESYRWMMENWPNAADEIWYGLPAFLGVSLQASAQIPGTDVRNEITNLGNIVAVERARQIGQAIGAVIDHSSATGENALENPNVRDELISATMPRVVSRFFSATEGDYVKSMRTGYPQVRGLGPSTRLLHGLGLNQVDVDRQQQAAQALYEDQQRTRAMITGLGSAYAQASLRGDTAEMEQTIQRALIYGLPLSSVMQSAANFGRRETESDSLSRFNAIEAARWQAALDQGR